MMICGAPSGTGTVLLAQVLLLAFYSTVPQIPCTNSRVVFGNYLIIKMLNNAFMSGLNKSRVSDYRGNKIVCGGNLIFVDPQYGTCFMLSGA